MSEPFVFDPRHSFCKTPFGAVPCGAAVTLCCRPLASEGFTHCAVILRGSSPVRKERSNLPGRGRRGTASASRRKSAPRRNQS